MNRPTYNPFVDDSGDTADEELAVRGKEGDRGALEQLARRHQPWIYNLAVRMVWSTDEAQDLKSECDQEHRFRLIIGGNHEYNR